jgi:hypothetical protein
MRVRCRHRPDREPRNRHTAEPTGLGRRQALGKRPNAATRAPVWPSTVAVTGWVVARPGRLARRGPSVAGGVPVVF